MMFDLEDNLARLSADWRQELMEYEATDPLAPLTPLTAQDRADMADAMRSFREDLFDREIPREWWESLGCRVECRYVHGWAKYAVVLAFTYDGQPWVLWQVPDGELCGMWRVLHPGDLLSFTQGVGPFETIYQVLAHYRVLKASGVPLMLREER